ncbi:glycosyltransferase family 2 protein [Actinoplanes sp. NPDC048988]|uniref:glycosyltransferase family 2 protein n=1 Tax=Actinoplanes sp. NPDC048988 TaxID=3363901 RepID=UPI003713B59C
MPEPSPAQDPDGVTVVVPTHTGRQYLVDRLLNSLHKAGAAAGVGCQVVVVDSAPQEQSRQLRDRCRRDKLDYLRGPQAAGAKRNIGAAAARYPIVLFIDSDCRATPELLRRHYEAHRDSPPVVAAIAGPTDMYGEMTPVWRILDGSFEYNQCYTWPRTYHRLGWATTSNLSVRTEVFHRLGGFRTDTYTPVGGEDVDLGFRLRAAGYQMHTAPQAVAEHTRENIVRLRQVAHTLFTYGRADVWLCNQHPQQRAPHANVAVIAAVVTALGLTGSLRWRPAALFGPAFAATIVAVRTARRHRATTRGSDPYGRRAYQHVQQRADAIAVLRTACMVCVDAMFDVGTMIEAVRRHQWSNLLSRFHYLDPRDFEPHAATQHAADSGARDGC